jgi:hypothetical protein
VRHPWIRPVLAIAVCLGIAHGAGAVVIHDEAVNGDLSNNRLAPTVLNLGFGVNSIIATSQTGDLEYYSIVLPAGGALVAINVTAYSQADIAFIAVQSGAIFTEPNAGANPANLLGYAHFGVSNGTLGTDILDNMGQGPWPGPAPIGFVPPLAPGTYTFWTQQTGPLATAYQLDFIVPEPGTFGLLALGLAALGLRRRTPR